MTQEELLARAEDLIAAFNNGDVERIVSAFCVDAREAVRLDAERLLEKCSGVELEVLRTVAAGNVVTTEWVARPRTHGQGDECSGVSVADYDIRGRISRYNRYRGKSPHQQPAYAR